MKLNGQVFGLPRKHTIFSYIGKYKGFLVLASLGGIFYNIVAVTAPIFLGKLLDAALANEFQVLQEAMAGVDRIKEFFEEPVENRGLGEYPTEVSEEAPIEVEVVEFIYDGKKNGFPMVKSSFCP